MGFLDFREVILVDQEVVEEVEVLVEEDPILLFQLLEVQEYP
jgi:hypothetical protein